ncbi:MAG: MFS transporter [Sphingomonadales bacterium]|nr:MFS transporter [Sphingomonadales bacterium]
MPAASANNPAARPRLSSATMVDMAAANFGTAIAFALQQGNMARIFQSLGADLDALPILMIAGPATGLLVQPLVGHFSDRTWCRLGRRRPYILGGAVLAALALLGMASAGTLAVAVLCYWLLDAALNVAIEPFRALVADIAPAEQRTRALAINGALGCVGAVIGFLLPFALAGLAFPPGAGPVPSSVRLALALAALVLLAGVGWTILRVREYPPEASEARPRSAAANGTAAVPTGAGWLIGGILASGALVAVHADPQLQVLALGAAGYGLLRVYRRHGRAPDMVVEILDDIAAMPARLRKLAAIHMLTWFALYIMWPFMTPVITSRVFHASDPHAAAYNAGADWVGVLYAGFNVVASLFGIIGLPGLAARLGRGKAHALCLAIGSLGFATLFVIQDRWLLLVPFAALGIAWASLLTLPYVMLADALHGRKLGLYTGIFNVFVVLPQIAVATVMGPALHAWFPGEPVWTMAFAGAAMALAALLTMLLRPDRESFRNEPAGRCDKYATDCSKAKNTNASD